MENALEKYRLASGKTFQEIAKLAGVGSRSTIFNHCRGLRKISSLTALKYHQNLGIPRSELRPDLWPPEQGDSATQD